ncbi:MAG: efflux RND transporter permease subunit, partial [Candidatus Aminicenantes bacterium]
MREKILQGLARMHARHPWRMLAGVALLTIAFGVLAAQIKVTMRWSDLLPSKDRRTVQYNRIIEEFVSATSIVVVVQGEEQRIKAFAEKAVPRIKAAFDPKDNSPYVRRVDYMLEMDFLKDHGLMLIKADDLENMKDVYMDPNLIPLLTNINNSMEKEYVGREESLSTREREDGAFLFLDGIQNMINILQQFVEYSGSPDSLPPDSQILSREAVDKLLFGEPYMLSYDKTALIMNVIPNFTMWDMGKVISGVDAIQETVDEVLKEFPGVEAGLTGIMPVGHDEMVYGEKSISYTTFIALVAVFFLLVFSFRMWVAPVLALSNLIVGIVWAVGAASLLVGTLNIMTYMMTVILIGLGIDFSIHMISGFTEERSLGKPIDGALEKTFLKSGKGILTGGLTTSIAFLTLSISSSRGMKELGIVTGVGLLTIMVSTFLFLPALLVLREQRFEKRKQKGKMRKKFVAKDISFKALGQTGQFLSGRHIVTLVASLLGTALLVICATQVTFDQNYMNLEPEGLPSITLQDVVLEKFDLSMDYALILAGSVEESREIAEQSKDLGSVALTEDISAYFPSKDQQEKKSPLISEIKKALQASRPLKTFREDSLDEFLQELERLEMNIMEIQDLAYLGGQDKVDKKCAEIVGKADDPDSRSIIRDLITLIQRDTNAASAGLGELQRRFAPYFKESVLRMSPDVGLQLGNLPQTVLDRYTNTERSRFLVTIFPADNIWKDAEFLKRFVEDLERVNANATGMPPVFRALIEIIGKDGRNAILLTLVVVFFVLWLDYRKPGHALMAMVPLTIGVFWMVGLMGLFGIKLTVVSIMGLPMIIGIGVDDGVHIVHRWRIEGTGK